MAGQWRRSSKSPPKGPRNHPATPTVASGPMYPTGPRAGRRPQGPGTPVEQVPQVVQTPEVTPTTAVEPPFSWRGQGYDPGPKGRYGVGHLEAEFARSQSRRLHLLQDYDQVSRSTRRALHELDMATIDLRMAENRRKIAAMQLEKARHGVLGVDSTSGDTDNSPTT